MTEKNAQSEAGLASDLNRELDTTSDEYFCVFSGKKIDDVLADIGREVATERAFPEVAIPDECRPVLAQIKQLNSLSVSNWYEVVYHDGENWAAYAGSDTFRDCERVVQWRYVADLMPSI